MRLTVNVFFEDPSKQDVFITLELFPDMPISVLHDSIQEETQVSVDKQVVVFKGQPLQDATKTLEEVGLADGDLISVYPPSALQNQQRQQPRQSSAQAAQSRQPTSGPSSSDAASPNQIEQLRLLLLSNPEELERFRSTNPEVAEAVQNPEQFAALIHRITSQRNNQMAERQRLIEELNSDPCNLENQAKIQEMIREEQVMENLQNAMEHAPEFFGRVHLLYVEVEINNVKVKAMVDSGAQTTIMSPQCAERCNLSRLLDKRFSGVMYGVGTAPILGRIHMSPIKLGSLFLPCSFTVMEGKAVDLLLGLDMLKRHQAVIDLAQDKLLIQGHSVSFLSESETPQYLLDEVEKEPTIPGPGGTKIGQHSGAVLGGTKPSSEEKKDDVSAPKTTTADPSSSAPPSTSQPSATIDLTTSQASSSTATANAGFTASEKDINELVSMGIGRQEAMEALRATDGNVEMAASLLFGL